jgi:hypothetical protein
VYKSPVRLPVFPHGNRRMVLCVKSTNVVSSRSPSYGVHVLYALLDYIRFFNADANTQKLFWLQFVIPALPGILFCRKGEAGVTGLDSMSAERQRGISPVNGMLSLKVRSR